MTWQKTHSCKRECPAAENSHFARRFTTRLRSTYTDLVENIEGIEQTEARLRYASLLLYRLIFLYFLQHMGLLSGDLRYLQNHLHLFQERQENGSGFYRDFLRPLFTGINQPENCSISLASLFTSHEIEQTHSAISISNEICAQIFTIFDTYSWQPCDETVHSAHEITPDILGELFEQEMNPREAGAYYTPAEITAYITRNTLLPAIFTRVRERCGKACAPDALLWQHLIQQPARYMFATASKGHELPLPLEIEEGLRDVARRQPWQHKAPESYALPGETWREVVGRREHTDTILAGLRQDSPGDLNRLVTWNLNQQMLALDTLRNCQEPVFLEAFYQSLRQITIIDPTCGSGAFLRAAISQLVPLYMACLERMEEICSQSAKVPLIPPDTHLFRAHLEEAGDAAQWKHMLLCHIVEHNLYGVDLVEEAVEVCRLRLYLKTLAASPNYRLARLPKDFGQHIRAGNSLLGSLHTNTGERADGLTNTHDQLAFHWNQAFPEPMSRGGFDVILGNPPYVEYGKARQLYTVDGYATMETGNLYALTIERSTDLLAPGGRLGMIVPSSATCTDGYRSLQKLLLTQQELHIASFSDQRGRLFALPHPRLCILLYKKPAASQPEQGRIFTTPYIKLGEESRASLFEHLNYTEVTHHVRPGVIPRYGSPLEKNIFAKLSRQVHNLGHYLDPTGAHPVYYTRKLSWFVQVTPFIPLILDAQGNTRKPSELKTLHFTGLSHSRIAFAALNSNLFYWLITTGSDCRNLNMREVLGLPLDLAKIHLILQQELCQLAQELENDLRKHARMKPMRVQGRGNLTIQCIYPAYSKSLIDEIDRALARHYGLSSEELDFLLHYDGKYRQKKTCM